MFLHSFSMQYKYIITKRLSIFCKKRYHTNETFGYRKPKDIKSNYVIEDAIKFRAKQSNFYRLLTAYRQYGHLNSKMNPLESTTRNDTQLDPHHFGLSENDFVDFKYLINIGKDEGSVKEAIEFLENAYRQTLSYEFMHLEEEEERQWFSNYIEGSLTKQVFDSKAKTTIATYMLQSQVFDNFMAVKFPGVKRYGAEGAESMMAFFYECFRRAANLPDLSELVVAMPHRGRLNVLTVLLNVQPVKVFSKLLGGPEFPDKYEATGDVLSHFDCSTLIKFPDTSYIEVNILRNPSHLEAINAVSMGFTRGKQLIKKDGAYGGVEHWSERVLNLQIHGDASIIGQGINQECLTLSRTPHFEIGGTLHLIVNNQLGFTTPSNVGRSSHYCSDLAKMVSAPIIHVNGDYPEDVVKATQIAFDYQRQFKKDVFIDLNCYRKWGHNELDDPTFTNPKLYKIINSKSTVPNMYIDKLIEEKVLSEDDKNIIHNDQYKWLDENLKAANMYQVEDNIFVNEWKDYIQARNEITTWDTGVDFNALSYFGIASVKYPVEFNIHPLLQKTHVANRITKSSTGERIDWSTAETMAFASLLYDGYNVRLSGQDVGRGTFSHRHVMLVDQETDFVHIPLNHLITGQQAFLEVANSILSEEAVLGFEYGMSVTNPRNLFIWEAQFGDFFNGAQIIFDTFISSGEAKWLWNSGLVVLLPHGYDGAGPEHSSSRIERFLQLTNSSEQNIDTDSVNMQVCQPSTPAQYFHLLRRQMIRNYRKPLIIITPKTLLRLTNATSNFADMECGTFFKDVIGDATVPTETIARVLITSGKHYYSLLEKRKVLSRCDVAIIRLECFCPFPAMQLQVELSKYSHIKDVIWCQEEPKNMGAWSFIKPRLENLLGVKVKYCGRPEQSAPAVGISPVHLQQMEHILNQPFT